MPKGRPTPKPAKAPKATVRTQTTNTSSRPKVTLRAPNVQARNPLIEKNIKAIKAVKRK